MLDAWYFIMKMYVENIVRVTVNLVDIHGRQSAHDDNFNKFLGTVSA